ncbi:hypothetical protein [Polyangium sorediatum]|uniref:Lipoprotein n=1 Tax=Polyangium sorediatum TaxID=889274 RepID=A0ABT6PA81_9BACT|nr:hypothetical protein [Polyangium sorediatum]MDI1437532.1 hypothetical protein [Polyangium sorediatum]
MKNTMLACLVALVLAAGCEQKKEEAPAAPPTPPKPAAELPRPPVGIAPPVEEKAAAEDDLPTPEDFEEEAEKDIASTNVEAEVDKLEKEIGE